MKGRYFMPCTLWPLRCCVSSLWLVLLSCTQPVLAGDPEDRNPHARGRMQNSAGILSPGMTVYELVNFYRVSQGLAAIDPRIGAPHSPIAHRPQGDASAVSEWQVAASAWSAALAPSTGWAPGAERVWDADDWVNCPAAAFDAANRTLAERAGRPERAWVREWVHGQQQVFAACGGRGDATLPTSAPRHAPDWFADDRRYQRAAFLLYRQRFAEAATAFEAIAADETSAWRDWGLYMAARAWLRRGTLQGETDGFTEARRRFEAILADPELAPRHQQARALIDLIDAREAPVPRAVALARALSGPIIDAADAARMLRDFRWLWRKSKWQQPWDEMAQSSDPDILQWIDIASEPQSFRDYASPAVVQERDDAVRARAAPHWRLLAAMRDVARGPLEPTARDWLAAVETSSPLRDAARWLLVLDAEQRGDHETAERELRAIAEPFDAWGESEQDLIGKAMIAYVRRPWELLEFGKTWRAGYRAPARVEFDPDYVPPREEVMRPEVNTLVATLPARRILGLAQDASFPPAFRRELLEVAWLRAVLSDRRSVARDAAREIVAAQPPIDIAHAAQRYLDTATRSERLDAVAIALERGSISPIPFNHAQFGWCSAEIWSGSDDPRPGWDRVVESVASPGRTGYQYGDTGKATRIDRRGYRYHGALGRDWRAEQLALWEYDNASALYARLVLPRIAGSAPTEDLSIKLALARGVLAGCQGHNPAIHAEWTALRHWADALKQTEYGEWNPLHRRRAGLRSWLWVYRFRYLPVETPWIDDLLTRHLPLGRRP